MISEIKLALAQAEKDNELGTGSSAVEYFLTGRAVSLLTDTNNNQFTFRRFPTKASRAYSLTSLPGFVVTCVAVLKMM